MSPLAAYLERYAEPEATRATAQVNREYRNILVVPCYAETLEGLEALLPAAQDLLVVIIANAPCNAPPAARARTLAMLRSLGGAGWRPLHVQRRIDLLVVDRATHGVPARQGVGLARKIGADSAAQLIRAGRIHIPWIYCTDADTTLPDDYFAAPVAERGAMLFNFHHQGDDPELHRMVQLYELHMRYYQNRLAWCGSRYAFTALGSTMALHAADYGIVRGFPKRNAGEDFHLLNKLAKVAPVTLLAGPTLRIRGRRSRRTPFGTGAALAQIGDDAGYLSYAPESFALLRAALEALEMAATGGRPALEGRVGTLLAELGYADFIAKAQRHYAPGAQLRRALTEWFDALKTLRFVHACRRYHPDAPLLASLSAQLGRPAERTQLLGELSRCGQITTVVGTGSQARQISARAE